MSNGDGNGDGPDMGRQLRRWGPLVVIAVVAIGVVIVLASSGGDDGGSATGDDDDTTEAGSGDDTGAPADDDTDAADSDAADDDTTPAVDPLEDGVVSWTEAAAAGIIDEIEWGERCDQELGQLAYPNFFALECYAPFEGDNGGVTYEGVTEDTIKVVWYTFQETDPILEFITAPIDNDDTRDEVVATIEGLVEFYGSFTETYGREVEVIRYNATGGAADEVAARADAETIARDIKPFMVWNAPLGTGFAETLAANGVMCMCLPGAHDFAQANAPFLHVITKSVDQSRILLAEYVGKRLAGGNAVNSGDFQDEERVFGHLYLETSDQSTLVAERFRDRLLDEYGVELAELVPYELDPGTLPEQAATRIARLKDAGVTSIIFAGDPVAPQNFTVEATAQEYFPEWILAGTALVDTNTFARLYDQQQWRHAFGMSNSAVPTSREIEGFYFLYNWFHGEEAPAADTINVLYQPSTFFALLQSVGPDLTPQNYIDTLHSGPPTRRGALTVPSISWGDQGLWPAELEPDYNGIDDVSEIWWDPDTVGLDGLDREGLGVYWYVDSGQRYLRGEWPDTEPDVFSTEGAVHRYLEIPESEAPPDYPSPSG